MTILTNLPNTGLVSNVPLDAMHLVYLGVTRQQIRHWLGDKRGRRKSYNLSDANIAIISERLENLSYVLPEDFNRRCRSLEHWKLWKATEFRHFLLYFGPAILKDVLPLNMYQNFLLLHISILILSSKCLVSKSENIRYAESLLINFIITFQNIYGTDSVTYNVHNLLHLSKDVDNYGSLEEFSAFNFENYICSLKKLIRKGERPLQQIARRLVEYETVTEIKRRFENDASKNKTFVDKIHYSGFLTNREFQFQYKKLSINSWNIDISDNRNNCVMLTNGTIVNVLNIGKSNNRLFLIGKRCIIKKDLFAFENCTSSNFGIHIVTENRALEDFPCNLIRSKIF